MQHNRRQLLRSVVPLTVLCLGLTAIAGDYNLDWYTLDGGGDMWCTGGDFELSGTIGQPDAGVAMTGGGFELTGGFWAGVPAFGLGDMNCDGTVNAYDIDGFICALSPTCDYEGMYPDCDRTLADCNGDGDANAYDIDGFIALVGG